jgi:hypothetical protein
VGGLRSKAIFLYFFSCHISLPRQGVKGWAWGIECKGNISLVVFKRIMQLLSLLRK